MKAKHFIVAERPRLAAITEAPKGRVCRVPSSSCAQCNLLCRQFNKPISGRERGRWSSSKDGTPQARAELFGGSAGLWIHEASKSIRSPRRLSHEEGKHYLQRFWEKLPDRGQIVVFDRSWYGRVLVERVEGIASKREWQRGYEEINQFERMLVADGIRIVKCFLAHHTGRANPKVQGSPCQPAQTLEAIP